MEKFKLLLTLLLVFALILCATSCTYPPSDTPPEEVPGEGIEGDGTGEKDDTGTPEDGNKPDSGDNSGGENTPPEGDENEGENTPSTGDDVPGTTNPDDNQPGGDNPPADDDNQGETDNSEESFETYIQKIKDEMDIIALYNLTEQEQVLFVASFDDVFAFLEWHNAAKEKYKEEHPGVDLEGGDFDLFG